MNQHQFWKGRGTRKGRSNPKDDPVHSQWTDADFEASSAATPSGAKATGSGGSEFVDAVSRALQNEQSPKPAADGAAAATTKPTPAKDAPSDQAAGGESTNPEANHSSERSPNDAPKTGPDAASAIAARLNATDNRAYRRLPVPRRDQLPATAAASEQLPANFTPAAAYAEPARDETQFDLRKYLWLLFRHRWLILSAAGLCLAVGFVNTLLTTPIYRATTTIQINRDVAKVVQGQDVAQVDDGRDAEFYQTQYELLKSRSLAERIVKTLNLQDDPAFMASDAPSPWSNLRRMIFGVDPASSSTASADVNQRQASAAGRVMGGLSLQPVSSSTILRVSFDSPNADVAQKVANAVADGYIADTLDRRYSASTYARTFLEDRLQQIKLKLEESEKQLVAYAEDKHIVTAGGGVTLTQTSLASANDELAKATNDRLRNELLWKQVQSADGLGIPQILNDKGIQDLRAKRADLEGSYKDKLGFFKPAYPDMRKLKAQIDEIDQQIAAEVGLITDSIKAAYDASVSEEASLTQRIEQLKADVTDFNNRNIQYTILQREVDTSRSLYDGLLQRYKEIGVAGGVGTNNVSIVDRAETPGAPFTPNFKKNLSLALMLGLLLGAGLAFGREQLDDTFKSPEDVEDNLGVPLLGIIPLAKSHEDHVKALDDMRSPVTEAYRSLRTALQFSTSSGVPKTLLVTSSRASEGKSTTALTLAQNYAQLGMKVLLIDADLRKPTLHLLLGCDDSVGLTNCLASTTIQSNVFQKTKVSGLTFVASGPLPPNPAELLAGPKMLTLLTVAAEQFELVILDGPPVAGLADAPLLGSMAAGTLFVIDGTKTRRNVAKAALKRLYLARAVVVGAVINKLDIRGPGYGYGYGYGYGDTSYYGAAQPKQLADVSPGQTGAKGA